MKAIHKSAIPFIFFLVIGKFAISQDIDTAKQRAITEFKNEYLVAEIPAMKWKGNIENCVAVTCCSQATNHSENDPLDSIKIRAIISHDTVSKARNLRNFSVLELYKHDSVGIFMFLEDASHSRRYILLCEKGSSKILWDKKYRIARELELEIKAFIARNGILRSDKRKIEGIFKRIYKNQRALYGENGEKEYYRI